MDGGNSNSIKSISDKEEGKGEGWNSELENYLYDVSVKCIEFRDIHEDSAIFYEKRFNLFSLLLIIVSFINSAMDIVPFEHVIYRYFITVISIFITTLATINKFLKYQEYSTKHRIGSQKFLELYKNITEEFLQDEKSRINGIRYIKWVGKHFVEIQKALPFPPQKILDRLKLDNDPIVEISPKSSSHKGYEGEGEETRIDIPQDNNFNTDYNRLRNEKFKKQILTFKT
jgi:hypothetical protein